MLRALMDRLVKPAAQALTLTLTIAGLPLAADARTDRPDLFVDVAGVVPDAVFDVRYFSTDNFVGTRVDGYGAARCFLTRPAAEALAKVAAEARKKGLGLRIFDCYRPARAVAHFARWASDLADEKTKPTYYPDVAKKDLFAEGYIAARSGHSRGSTLDLTLFDLSTRRDLDMGTPFDLFSPRSWPDSPTATAAQRANRRLLAGLMAQNGFKPFDKEWWHFTLKDEPFPDTYFDFPIE
ncbi:M15 family metallopeptidase [Xanthobacter aminoxidans]|uniref:M15 family metallopeptidase n=1 Tax=Xanthobacter aminoxidans TaxID=186280 RepID=UPI002022F23C|nr:M15 family metallopeptidase [Xanthobacter aminoxidans]MCL8384390.1 M15 family metallopeptidase [Xanthobacter aminoxidans]